MHERVLFCKYQHTKFEVLSFTNTTMINHPTRFHKERMNERTTWPCLCNHRGLGTINLPNTSAVSISTRYRDMKGDTKCGKWGGLG